MKHGLQKPKPNTDLVHAYRCIPNSEKYLDISTIRNIYRSITNETTENGYESPRCIYEEIVARKPESIVNGKNERTKRLVGKVMRANDPFIYRRYGKRKICTASVEQTISPIAESVKVFKSNLSNILFTFGEKTMRAKVAMNER